MPSLLPPRARQATRLRRGPVISAIAVVLAVVVIVLASRAKSAEAAVLRADPEIILGDPALRRTALAGGRPIYAAHCAVCHGAGGKGDPHLGVPDLTDDDHLYGEGRVAEIEDIARHGIRAHDRRGANLASMPAYAQRIPYAGEPLPTQAPAQIEDLTQTLLWFTGRARDPVAARRGRALFTGSAGCWDCHSADGGGDPAIGAPSLSDATWLYGGSHDQIYRSIAHGRAGMSPAFARALTAAQLRDVAVYVASLAPQRRVPR